MIFSFFLQAAAEEDDGGMGGAAEDQLEAEMRVYEQVAFSSFQ